MRSVLGIQSSLAYLAFGLLCTTGCAGVPWASPSQQAQATPQFEDPAGAALAMAKLCEAQGSFEEAAAHCHRAIEANPEMVDAYHRLAIIEAKQELFEQSFSTFSKALRLSPNSPQLLADLGYALYLDERYDMSEKALRKAISIDSELPVAKTHLAMVLERSEQDSAVDPAEQFAAVDDMEAADDAEAAVIEDIVEVQTAANEAAKLPDDVANARSKEQTDAITDAAQAITQRAKPLIIEDSAVQPARYVLEPAAETSERYASEEAEVNTSQQVEQAVFYKAEEESFAAADEVTENVVQPAAALLPVQKKKPALRRPGNPLADLSDAMTLLETRRPRKSSECSCDSCDEEATCGKLEATSGPIRLNVPSSSRRSTDHSTLNILE